MTNKSLSSILNNNDKNQISEMIYSYPDVEVVASDLNNFVNNKLAHIKDNENLKEATVFAIELVLMRSIKRRKNSSGNFSPLFDSNFYFKLNSIL